MRTARRFTLLCIAVVSLGFASSFAAAAPQGAPTKMDAPPPPGIDDPGVTAAPASQDAPPAAKDDDAADQDPLAPLPKPDTRPVRGKADRDSAAVLQRMAASDRSTRQQGTDTVEEYRQNGKVWMIHIVRQNGTDSTFMDTTGTGRLTRDERQGPVAPVYFSLYDWN